MQGIKFNLDTNSIAQVKEEFNKLIQELENNAKIDIKVNNKIFQELNTQINQTNNQLQNLINKNNDVGHSFTNISNKVKGGKLFDPNSFVEFSNALDRVKDKYSQLGQVNFNNKTFNPVTKELESFVVNIQKADGVVQKLKYDLQTVNGNKGFVATNLNEIDNSAKIREKQLQTEQKINRQIEQQNQKLNEQVTKSQDSLNAIQMQWQQKIKGLLAGDIVPKDKILQLESMIKNINLGTTKSDMQVIKNYYNDLVKLEQQLVAEKNKEKDATKATMEAYVKEQDRIAKMGQFKAKLPTQNVFKDDQALKAYIKSLYDANAKITQFANSTKNAEQSQRTITVVTRNVNNEIHREKLVIDEATQSVYKQSEAISSNTSKMKGFGDSLKGAFSGIKGYMSTMLGLYAVIGQMRNGFSFLNNVDKKLTDISIITNKSKEELQGYAKGWNEIAINLGTVTDEVLDANEKYLRAGKSLSETNSLVQTNIKLSRIANDTNADTAEYLIALSNAYGLNADGVKKYANEVAHLDTTTATTTSRLNKSMLYTAQTAVRHVV
ncbi:phage tail tape measure protein [Clostridium botulinum]|uniref:phage tail tape measure protein n=1 Tax=Clostridium botulinum TaxID=1491 RepID=UPI001E28C3A5|nr:phage tail tape measure protein [Clostridium botulinum]MCD3329279.1 phage tail tape measure protein [Clostridium botulinum D/C]MCD3335169.1 phage tail tape measure protein [Clostridium botulinum D/C]MCD3343846.1 phage tail tape measure protein [Clostridium botulinum D/C]MCD3352415.1 phage tail tape measure protein [Clostridium botulinum D/C]